MAQTVQQRADSGHITHDTGGRFIVRDKNRFDRMGAVGAEGRFKLGHRCALAPRAIDDLHIQTMALAKFDPTLRKHTVTARQNLVTG